jgi:hypothetical protein
MEETKSCMRMEKTVEEERGSRRGLCVGSRVALLCSETGDSCRYTSGQPMVTDAYVMSPL